MDSTTSQPSTMQPFRFLDLPGELRNKIYTITLCTFKRLNHEDEFPSTNPQSIESLAQKLDTALLCTNRQVYKEAYDILIKINRFVQIKVEDNMCLPMPPNSTVITTNRNGSIFSADARTSMDNFKGYVMSLSLASKYPRYPESIDADDVLGPAYFMILGDDLPLLCSLLDNMEGDQPFFNSNLKLSIRLVPEPPRQPMCGDTLKDFFTNDATTELFRPLRRHIHGVKDVEVVGINCQAAAVSARAKLAQDRYTSYERLVRGMRRTISEGLQNLESGHIQQAALYFRLGLRQGRMVAQSSTWRNLNGRYGRDFQEAFCSAYVDLSLNLSRANNLEAKAADNESDRFDALVRSEHAIMEALSIIKGDRPFWRDFRWGPSEAQWNSHSLRRCEITRLGDIYESLDFAIADIQYAIEWATEETMLEEMEQERDALLAWKASLEQNPGL